MREVGRQRQTVSELQISVDQLNINLERQNAKLEIVISNQARDTATIARLSEDTHDVIQLMKDLQGAARVGKAVQAGAVSIAKLTAIAASMTAIWEFILKGLLV